MRRLAIEFISRAIAGFEIPRGYFRAGARGCGVAHASRPARYTFFGRVYDARVRSRCGMHLPSHMGITLPLGTKSAYAPPPLHTKIRIYVIYDSWR